MDIIDIGAAVVKSKEYTDEIAASIVAGDIKSIAREYDATSTYAVGNYCLVNAKLYRCNTAITVPEAWNVLHWTETTSADEICTLSQNKVDTTAGTEIPASSDLNSYTTPGTYFVASSANAETIINTPTTGYAYKLIVHKIVSSVVRIKQIAIINDNQAEIERHYNGSSWTEWKHISYIEYVDQEDGRLGNAIGMQGWNQMLNTSGVTTRTHSGITFTTNSNGTITLSGTSTRQAYSNNFPNMSTIANHKYLAILHGASDTGAVSLYNSTDNKFARGNGIIYTAGGTRDIGLNVLVNGTGITIDSLVVTPQMYDLTAIFGAGNEPSTVAEFRKLFPATYYPYDNGQGKVGFVELGSLSSLADLQTALLAIPTSSMPRAIHFQSSLFSPYTGYIWHGFLYKMNANYFAAEFLTYGTTRKIICRYENGTWSHEKVAMMPELLWTNSSPSTAFASKTISLDLSNYSSISVLSVYTGNPTVIRGTDDCVKGKTTIISQLNTNIFIRSITVNATGVTFSDCTKIGTYGSTSGNVTDNVWCVPYQIYGII